jgi:hypothetical protein
MVYFVENSDDKKSQWNQVESHFEMQHKGVNLWHALYLYI